jgi:hypothetical protein
MKLVVVAVVLLVAAFALAQAYCTKYGSAPWCSRIGVVAPVDANRTPLKDLPRSEPNSQGVYPKK